MFGSQVQVKHELHDSEHELLKCAVSFIWKDRSAQSLGYIQINMALTPLERQNRSTNIIISVSVYNEIIC